MNVFDVMGKHPNITTAKNKAHRRNMNGYVDWTGGDLEWNGGALDVEDIVVRNQ